MIPLAIYTERHMALQKTAEEAWKLIRPFVKGLLVGSADVCQRHALSPGA